jgi:hypothetical protein
MEWNMLAEQNDGSSDLQGTPDRITNDHQDDHQNDGQTVGSRRHLEHLKMYDCEEE